MKKKIIYGYHQKSNTLCVYVGENPLLKSYHIWINYVNCSLNPNTIAGINYHEREVSMGKSARIEIWESISEIKATKEKLQKEKETYIKKMALLDVYKESCLKGVTTLKEKFSNENDETEKKNVQKEINALSKGASHLVKKKKRYMSICNILLGNINKYETKINTLDTWEKLFKEN